MGKRMMLTYFDIFFSVNDDQEPIIAVSTTLESTYKHYPEVMLLS